MRAALNHRLVAYSMAVVAPLICLALRWPLWSVLGDAVPHMTFFPAVMIAAYFGGFGPGLVATIFSALIANFFLTQQFPSFEVNRVNDVAALILFVLVSTIISGLCESLHRARRRIVADERRRAEEALSESEQRFRTFVDHATDAFFLHNEKFQILDVNRQACQSLGYSRDELLGMTPSDFDSDITAAHIADIDLKLKAGEIMSFESRHRRKDGTHFPVEIRGRAFYEGNRRFSLALVRDITERKRTEKALRASESRFRALIDHATDAIFLTDRSDGRVLDVNRQACESLGYTRDELMERTAFDVDPNFTLEVKERLPGRFGNEDTVVVDTLHRRKDGSVFPVEVRVRSLVMEGRSCDLALVRDMTERKKIEDDLRESEVRLHRIFDSLPAAAYTCDTDGLITYFNERATGLWGRTPKLNHSDDRFCGSFKILDVDGRVIPHEQCLMATAIKQEREIKGLEVMVERADGSRRNALAHINPMWDFKGRLVGAVNVLVDITDLKRAEEKLRESEHRWRSMTEALPQLVWTAAPDGACDYFSTQWTQHTGVPASELLGWQWLEVLHPDDREGTRRFWTDSVAGRGAYDVEYRVRRFDGVFRWFKTRGVPIRDSEGNIFKWFGTCTDITDAKLAAEELRIAKEVAVSANVAKDEFLANVSHEIRTPMNAILGMTELVLETPLTEQQRQSLKTVKLAADNLLGIINDLLDFSKIEAGKLELDPAEFSLRAALGDTVRSLAVRAHRKGLELVCHVQPDAPDALVGDVGRLRQVLLNLVGNAIKFTDDGEVVVQAEVLNGTAPDGELDVHFIVRDTGIGIPPDKQERIFRAFEQEDTSTTRKYGGTGLGLTIAARLVTLMGGSITVESAPNHGSTFAFTARFGRRAQILEQPHVSPPILLHNLPVLIVDDNNTNRRILEDWLRGWRMKPLAVGDGLTAIEVLARSAACGRAYPLVLLDARMPHMDGLTLATLIRQRAELAATNIILLTSGDRPGDPARFREQRVSAYLLKPVQQDELLETVYRVMSQANGDAASVAQQSIEPLALTSAPLDLLVAEDNDFNAQLLEQLLVRKGHRVHLANDGQKAVALAEAGSFDLLLLDVHMPKMDGFQVVQAIRDRERIEGGHLPIIALTARSRKVDRDRCLAAGMDDFLVKPIQANDMWLAIERVANNRPPAGPRQTIRR